MEAQQRLDAVSIDEDLRLRISAVCGELNVDGLRGDIVTNRAARALAAFEGRVEVTEDDVARVASCCLRHRLRKDPLEQVDSGERVVKVFCKVFERSESSVVPTSNWPSRPITCGSWYRPRSAGGLGVIDVTETRQMLDRESSEPNRDGRMGNGWWKSPVICVLIRRWRPQQAAVEKFFFYRSTTPSMWCRREE